MKKAATKFAKQQVSNDVSTAVLPSLKIMFGPTRNKGRGVICAYPIEKGEIVEYAPAFPIPKEQVTDGSVLENYVLTWNEGLENEEYCMVGGYVMLYNHSNEPNIAVAEDRANTAFRVTATRRIEKGEELCWNYNCEIWFDTEQ